MNSIDDVREYRSELMEKLKVASRDYRECFKRPLCPQHETLYDICAEDIRKYKALLHNLDSEFPNLNRR